jgi:hypothetical protein
MLKKILLGAAVVAGATAFTMSVAASGNPNPGVLPPKSSSHGATYAQWSERWWQWAWNFPYDASVNPVLDTTGALVASGQSGHVWFLAGTFGGTATRTATIPTGTALFFPIVNSSWQTWPVFTPAQYPPYGYSPADQPFTVPGAEQAARDAIAWGVDNATTLVVEVDGSPLTITSDYRVKSAAFTANMLANNLYGIPAGVYPDSVSDGYWVMLAPLSHGQHTIHVHGGFPGFDTEVFYRLTVQ